MSFLLAQGHPSASRYPLWQLGMEASIATERLNTWAVTEALLTQNAVAALLDRKAAAEWKKLVKRLLDGAE